MAEVAITVRHTFETGHRLPHLEGKCQSLHGHSWQVEVAFDTTDPMPESGVIAEFGLLKAGLRQWVDDRLDHGLMLGANDPLTADLSRHGKVYVFGRSHLSEGLAWPTVENVAILLSRVGREVGLRLGVRPLWVSITETPTNTAWWSR